MRAYSYSMTCTACTGDGTNALKYILVAFMPLTLFYVVILIFGITFPLLNFKDLC